MKKIVFYSWQSDLPNSSNRGLIEEALKKAVKSIGNDESIKVDPVVDRDTSGIGGSPDISKTIFEKIIKSDVFVADVSIINKDYGGRKVPNPNVLIELGYALKSLGYEKVILVMNTGFGEISLLPFDLKTKRVLSYDTTKDKKQETKILSDKLKFQLQTIFKNKKVENIEPDVINTIKKQERDRIPAIRNYMTSLSQGIDKLYPGDGMMDRNSPDPKYDEKIIDALEKKMGNWI